jgi:hypothetical protein
MKPGANTATITKRKYQTMNSVQTGPTKDPKRRLIVQKSRLARTAS